MIARDAALAGYEEARIHVQHLSAAESVEVVRAAKAAGVRISCRGHARTTSASPTRRCAASTRTASR